MPATLTTTPASSTTIEAFFAGAGAAPTAPAFAPVDRVPVPGGFSAVPGHAGAGDRSGESFAAAMRFLDTSPAAEPVPVWQRTLGTMVFGPRRATDRV